MAVDRYRGSVDALKKNAGFVSLRDHFERTYGEPESNRFLEAQRNFVNSLAAYSLASYVLQIKDRHNGNVRAEAVVVVVVVDEGVIGVDEHVCVSWWRHVLVCM